VEGDIGMSTASLRLRQRPDWSRLAFIGAVFVIILLVWQGYVTFVYDRPIPLPTPGSTIGAFLEMSASGELWQASFESAQVLVLGAIPGIVLGIALGLVIGSIPPLNTSLAPYIYAFYATPFPALIPIFVLLFGLGNTGKAMIVFTLVITTVLLQTIAGVRNVDARFLEVARSFGSPPARTLLEVHLPASMTFIVAGIRLAIGRALVGVVVAEFDTALSGLGALIFRYSGRLALSHAFVPAVVFSVTGILIYVSLRKAEQHLEKWRQLG
jgi:ABC-type nitrate/sulfonate/bicarbonate transport system permease component